MTTIFIVYLSLQEISYGCVTFDQHSLAFGYLCSSCPFNSNAYLFQVDPPEIDSIDYILWS